MKNCHRDALGSPVMLYNTLIHKGTSMSDLQKKVLLAIKSHTTPEEQADAAIRAVSIWYWEQGYFAKSYELDDQLPNKFTV
jgi:hypothetical protein